MPKPRGANTSGEERAGKSENPSMALALPDLSALPPPL